jgi:DNA polymerase
MDAFTALRLQTEWGADEALEAEPIDRLRPAPSRPAASEVRPAPVAAPGGARVGLAERAAQAAAGARTLDELRAAIAGFEGIALRDTATNLVFAEGAAASGLLFIGEAPNADADRAGSPFAGRIGAYLELMLRSIGLDRGNMMLAPLIPWRPPGDRPPSPSEIAACAPFLYRLIALVAPRWMVLLGTLPARTLLGTAPMRRRGPPEWQKAGMPQTHTSIDTLTMPSPAVLLQTPSQRRETWAVLRLLRRSLDAQVTPM